MGLVTTQPPVLSDGTADHTYTYHHQDPSKPLTGVYASNLATNTNPENLVISHDVSNAKRKRALAQLVAYENQGTTEMPNWQPIVVNLTLSRPQTATSAGCLKVLAQMADLIATAGFQAGFAAEYIQ